MKEWAVSLIAAASFVGFAWYCIYMLVWAFS